MQGICLKLFVSESRLHNGMLLYEWLLEQAKDIGVLGGTAFRAIAGFGRHGRLHEEAFFELAGELPVEIEFLVSRSRQSACWICSSQKICGCFTLNIRPNME